MSTSTINTKHGKVKFDTARMWMRDDIIEHMANDIWTYMYGDQQFYDEYMKLYYICEPNGIDWSWMAAAYDGYSRNLSEVESIYDSRCIWTALDELRDIAKCYRTETAGAGMLPEW